MKRSISNWLVGVSGMVAAVALLMATPTLAGKPTPTPTPTGKVFYDEPVVEGLLWHQVNPDGTGNTILPSNVNGVPSRNLHGNYYWFIEVRALPGQTYFSGAQRYELFAVRSDGNENYTVQLTDDVSLEVGVGHIQKGVLFPTARWIPGDAEVSFSALRVDQVTGEIIEGGLWVAPIYFDASNNVLALGTVPDAPTVPLDIDIYDGVANVQTFDWNPTRTSVVYLANSSTNIYVYDLNPPMLRLISAGQESVSWSPAVNKIVFGCDSDICTINPDGSGYQVVVTHQTGGWIAAPMFSNTGAHIVYRNGYMKHNDIWPSFAIMRCTATGGSKTAITPYTGNTIEVRGWSN